ncbi:MAG: DUF5717 family protein [Bacteroidia bacterium]|nr:DUF5717 family protein [Bacteroidia bacterium]
MRKLTSEELEQLIEEGWKAYEEQEFEQAADTASQLIEAGEESGYILLANVRQEEEDMPGAEALLREGMEKLPESWQIPQHLGTLLSAKGELDAALEVFDVADQHVTEDERDFIRMSRATVYYQQQAFDAALEALQAIEHPDLVFDALSYQMTILDEQEEYAEIIDMAEDALAELPDPESTEDVDALSRIYMHIASAWWHKEKDKETATDYIREAVELDRSNPDTLWLIREINGVRSEKARLFSLLVSGQLEDENANPVDFLATYAAIADSEEEALEMIRDFEVEAVDKDSLKVVESASDDNEDDDPKGLYMVGEFGFFSGDEEEEEEA